MDEQNSFSTEDSISDSTSDSTGSRPDLSGISLEVLSYIKHLEAEVTRLQSTGGGRRSAREDAPLEPSEPPTTINILTISQRGSIKRTPRHHYPRQRRSGMGIFDLEMEDGDQPQFLVSADEGDGIVLITDHARAFHVAVNSLSESAVRDRGQSVQSLLPLRDGESIKIAMADRGGSQVLLVTDRGQIRRYASQHFGPNMQSGLELFNPNDVGIPISTCWTSGAMELFIATRRGRAIRFAEKLVPVRGCLGMRVEMGDEIVSIAAAPADGGIFMATDDGKGTIRLLSGFSANKAPGSGGKTAMKTDALIGAMGVQTGDDIFVISELGKIIRFQADDVPAKTGVVQGVNCMALRADNCVAMAASTVG